MLSARAQFTPRNGLGQFIPTVITPGVTASVQASVDLVRDTAQRLAPVDTGALRDSITSEVDASGTTVVGRVGPHVPYAVYVEFGTGRRGAQSPDAGEGPYDPNWAGMVPQPYMRPAVDESKGSILDLFKSNISLTGV